MPFSSLRWRHIAFIAFLITGILSSGCRSLRRPQESQADEPPPEKKSRLSRLEIPYLKRPPMPQAKRRTTPPKPSAEAPLAPPPPPDSADVKPAGGDKSTAPETPPQEQPATLDADAKTAKLRQLHAAAAGKFDQINDYVVRFTKREVVNGKQSPEDVLFMRFRKEPFSVHFKWLEGTAHQNREILYVKGKYQNKMQIRLGKGDPLPGMRTSLDPRSERAMANNRRAIDEAGIGNMIARFGLALDAFEKGANTYGTLEYLGSYPRPESPTPLECVVQHVPPGVEKHLPQGGQRYWFFNADTQAPEHGLPVLLITYDDKKKEVEYYCHERFSFNVSQPEDFDADALWSGRSKAKR